jgi:hypothetical protein
MAEIFATLGTWNWLIFGFILMALELLAPGVFLFWLGLSSLLVGLVSFAINPSWQAQRCRHGGILPGAPAAAARATRSSTGGPKP